MAGKECSRQEEERVGWRLKKQKQLHAFEELRLVWRDQKTRIPEVRTSSYRVCGPPKKCTFFLESNLLKCS